MQTKFLHMLVALSLCGCVNTTQSIGAQYAHNIQNNYQCEDLWATQGNVGQREFSACMKEYNRMRGLYQEPRHSDYLEIQDRYGNTVGYVENSNP